MPVFISLVGQQPAAVAVCCKTLSHYARTRGESIQKVILLPTDHTHMFAVNLKKLFEKWKFGNSVDIEIQTISLTPHPKSRQPLAHEIIAQEAKKASLVNEKVYFNFSAGLNYHISYIAWKLHSIPSLYPCYTDFNSFCSFKDGQYLPLLNLGIKKLLRLHGIKATVGSKTSARGEGVTLSSMEDPQKKIHFQYILEKKGRIFALKTIKYKGDRKECLEKARRLKSLVKNPGSLHQLIPQITVLTNDDLVAARLATASIQTILLPKNEFSLQNGFQKWERQFDIAPGDKLPGKSDHSPPYPCPEKNGAGGKNGNLIVCLGNDPSATLLAIYSHTPQNAYVCYDHNTPFVRGLAGRLYERVPDLPVYRLTLIRTDHLGSGIKNEPAFQIESSSHEPWIVNTTPGTKAQAWSLATIENAKICTLIRQKSEAASFDHDDKQVTFPFKAPPIRTQAYVVGGAFDEEKTILFHEIKKQSEFLQLMTTAVAKYARFTNGLIQFDQIKGIEWEEGVKNGKSFLSVSISKKSTRHKGILPGSHEEGFWLEPVVAHALYQAGGKLVSDLSVGISWYYLFRDMNLRPKQRSELDIGIIWAHQYLAVSCKTCPLDENRQLAAREEIFSVGKTGLGRFCYPILVYPFETADPQEREREVLEISLQELDKPEVIRERINAFVLGKQTTVTA